MSGQSLPLRMAGGSGAILGRFVDPISLVDQPLLFYSNAEEIAEDQELPSDSKEKEGTEFNKRKRKNRYRRRSELVMEGVAGTTNKAVKNTSKLKYIGTAMDTKTEKNSARYALLQVVKEVSTDSLRPEMHVNVVRVGDWYDFRKPVPTKILTLDAVTAEIEKSERQRKETNKRYSQISKALEKREIIAQAGDTEEDKKSSMYADDPYKTTGGGRGRFRGHMNATGVDYEAEDEFKEYCGFEYEAVASDDEVDNDEEQAQLDEKEDRVMPLGGAEEDADFYDSDSSNEDSEENEEDDKDATDAGGLSGSKMANASVLAASRQMKQHIDSRHVDSDSDAASDVSRGSSNRSEGSSTAVKRKASSPTPSSGAAAKDISSDQRPIKRSAVIASAASGDSTSLTVSNVRAHISKVGGRITTKELGQAFKKSIKALGERGKQRFKEIVVEVTSMIDDPRLGKCLVSKQ